jgi:tRNA pseudouridine38-40 synthase
VRNLAGLLIEVGTGYADPAWATEVLQSRDRRRGAETAPPEGLYLRAIRYPAAFGLPGSCEVEPAGRSVMIPPH